MVNKNISQAILIGSIVIAIALIVAIGINISVQDVIKITQVIP